MRLCVCSSILPAFPLVRPIGRSSLVHRPLPLTTTAPLYSRALARARSLSPSTPSFPVTEVDLERDEGKEPKVFPAPQLRLARWWILPHPLLRRSRPLPGTVAVTQGRDGVPSPCLDTRSRSPRVPPGLGPRAPARGPYSSRAAAPERCASRGPCYSGPGGRSPRRRGRLRRRTLVSPSTVEGRAGLFELAL